MIIDSLEGTLETKPKVDLLGRGTRVDVSSKARNSLDRFDPLIDVVLKCIQERAVVEQFWRQVGYAGSVSLLESLLNCPLYHGVDDQMSLGNFYVLLQV